MPDRPPIPAPGAEPGDLHAWAAGAQERRAEDLELSEQYRRGLWLRCWIQIFVIEWAAVALLLWSFHTSSMFAGTVAFWSALALGDGGFLVLFVRTWRKTQSQTPS